MGNIYNILSAYPSDFVIEDTNSPHLQLGSGNYLILSVDTLSGLGMALSSYSEFASALAGKFSIYGGPARSYHLAFRALSTHQTDLQIVHPIDPADYGMIMSDTNFSHAKKTRFDGAVTDLKASMTLIPPPGHFIDFIHFGKKYTTTNSDFTSMK